MKAKKQGLKVVRIRPGVHYMLLVAAVKARRDVQDFASDALAIGLKMMTKAVPEKAVPEVVAGAAQG